MTPAEIEKLQSLAEQGKARDLAIYAGFVQKLQVAQQEIDDLHEQYKAHSKSTNIVVVARWQAWAEGENRRLNEQAHAIDTDKELARKVAIKSAAKVQALEYLLKDAKKAEIVLRRRRAEQNGMPSDV